MTGPRPRQHQALSRHWLQPCARHRYARHASREGGRARDDLVAHEAARLPQSARGGGSRRARRTRRRRRRGAPAARSDHGGGPTATNAAAFGRGGRNAPAGAAAGARSEIFETYNKIAPAVTLDCEDYGLVFRLAENNQKPMVRLDLDATLLGEQPVFNTIATIKGTEKPNEYVMLSAHFDSWDGSSGATDNGTGTMMAMEAMRILKTGLSAPEAHDPGRSLGERGAGAQRLHARSPRSSRGR